MSVATFDRRVAPAALALVVLIGACGGESGPAETGADVVSPPDLFDAGAPSEADAGADVPFHSNAHDVRPDRVADAGSDAAAPGPDVPRPDPLCPVARFLIENAQPVVPPGTAVRFIGDHSHSMAGEVRRWRWFVDQPWPDWGEFLPSERFPNPQFEVGPPGVYTFCLEVWDADERKSCEPSCRKMLVAADGLIQVQLAWRLENEPVLPRDEDEPGPDLDLHLVHPDAPSDLAAVNPYFDPVLDCWAGNPAPDWPPAGDEAGDPVLLRADDDGVGPEFLHVLAPEPGLAYEIAVHYPDDHGLGAVLASVQVFVSQQLVVDLSAVRLAPHDLWCVAFVDWPSGQVSLCEALGGGYRIAPDYPSPRD